MVVNLRPAGMARPRRMDDWPSYGSCLPSGVMFTLGVARTDPAWLEGLAAVGVSGRVSGGMGVSGLARPPASVARNIHEAALLGCPV